LDSLSLISQIGLFRVLTCMTKKKRTNFWVFFCFKEART